MNYIIFGGSGFIGTHLIHLLKNECVKPGEIEIPVKMQVTRDWTERPHGALL